MVYFIILALLLFSIYTFDFKRHKVGDMVMYILICIFLIVIAGLRYRIGGDSIGYESEYRNLPTLAHLGGFRLNSIRWEPGFTLFMIFSKTISSDFTLFQFLHATIVNSIIFWFVYHNTKNKFLAITLYVICLYLNFNTEVLREALAVCIFLLAWPFFRRGNWILYYAFCIMASFFHMSAVFTFILPLFAIPGIRNGFRLGYHTIFICIIIFAVSFYLGKKFFTIIKALSQTDSISDRAEVYSKSSYGTMGLNIFGLIEAIVKNILIPALALWYYRLTLKADQASRAFKDFRKMEIMVMAGMYVSVVSLVIFIIIRFTNYTLMFTFVMISSCFFQKIELKNNKKFRLQPMYWLCIFAVLMVMNFKFYFSNTYGSTTHKRYMLYYPYYSRLEPTEDSKREEILRYAIHIK